MNTATITLAVRRCAFALFLAVVLNGVAGAVSAAELVGAPIKADPAALEFLLGAASKELKEQSPAQSIAVQKVLLGFIRNESRGSYILCGYFKSGAGQEAKWIAFATIKTSDYEQWIGSTAKGYCSSKQIKWFPGDHSSVLKTLASNSAS